MNWDQLKTILWLRWRLTRNQWRRGGNIGGVVAAVLVVIGISAACLLFAGAIAAGAFAFRKADATALLIAWDVITAFFLFIWMIGLISELQRSESIDLARLLHLPVAMGQIFFVNYVASHCVLSIIICVPVMVGLAIGLSFSRGFSMLLLIPLALAMVSMITAWTYCLRGWMAALMSNPRRKRTIVVIITMFFVLISQLPNIYFNVIARKWSQPRASRSTAEGQRQHNERKARDREAMQTFVAAQKYFPPFWLPVGARALAQGDALPALLGTAGCLAIGAMGLRRAYVTTLRAYRGDDKKTARKEAVVPADSISLRPGVSAPRRPFLVERSLPGVPEPAAAIALATLRSMVRAPEVKMQWATSVMVTMVFGAMMLLRAGSSAPPPFKPLMVTGLIAMTMFMLVQSLGNQFGFDRGGFRAVVLAPINRRDVLLGKNLANLPLAATLTLALLIACAVWLKLPILVTVTILLQFVVMYLLVCMLGNLLSILVPYRIAGGSLKPAKMPAKAQFVMFITHMLFPAVMLPAFVPVLAQLGWSYLEWPAFPIGLVTAAVLASAAATAYWFSLIPLARLLHRREQAILQILASDVE